jgi:hypothetical protein
LVLIEIFVAIHRYSLSRMFLRMSNRISTRCQVCKHPERWRIELLRAGGASLDALAAKFELERDAIHRHWHNHVTAEMKASYLCGPAQLAELAEKAAAEGDSVLDHLRMIRTVLTGQLAAVTEAGDARGATYVARGLTATLEAMARITGELGSMAQSINITNNIAVLSEHPAFLRVQAAMLKALAPFPDARFAVVDALRGLETGAPAGSAAKVIDHVAA